VCAAGVIFLSSGTASARRDWAGRYSRCVVEETDETMEMQQQWEWYEITHEDEQHYKHNIGEEVSGLSKAWWVEFEASAVCPHYGYRVREADDIALDRRNSLK
jgi:hypothetical protein